jgi:YfiH family protein
MTAQAFGRVSFDGIHAIALNRNGGFSKAPFDSLNLASYVGDDPESVAANISAVRDMIGAQGLLVMNAQHGNTVQVVSELSEVSILPMRIAPPGDGLVTKQPNLALAALAADCVPFGLIDPVNRVIAVGHAGWRGVLANVMQSLIDEFVAVGGQLDKTQAVIGPAICAECYEVPMERVERFRDVMPEAISSPRKLDLTAGVKSVLVKQVAQIHALTGCTLENSDLFSYRRAAGEPTGRGGLVISISSD